MLTLDDVERAIRNMRIAKTVDIEFRNDKKIRIAMTTDHIRYSIAADLEGTTYLGAIAYSLDPKGGGNDLWDGELNEEALADVCWDIECYDALASGACGQRHFAAQPMGWRYPPPLAAEHQTLPPDGSRKLCGVPPPPTLHSGLADAQRARQAVAAHGRVR